LAQAAVTFPQHLPGAMADKICDVCKKEITGQVLKADGTQFHPECFKCDGCGNLLKGPFHKKDGKRICEACIPKVTCFGCKKEIVGAATKANGNSYHPECFKCEVCAKSLASGFFKVGDKLVCKDCATKGQEDVKQIRTCLRCEKPISGKIVLGDRDDAFHEECFTCEDCNEPLDQFVVDENRKFTYQKARYVCQGCYEKSKKKAKEAECKPCSVCKEPCLPDDSSLHLLDGYALHWACFICKGCGKAEKPDGDTSTMRLLRSKVEMVRKDKYFCEACFKGSDVNLGAAPDLKVDLRIPFGTYVGKQSGRINEETAYAIRLMEGSKCWLDCTTTTRISSGTWHAEGTYEEELSSTGEVATIKFTNVAIPFGGGPAKGEIYMFSVEKGASNSVLVCEGIKCPLQIGVPDFEIAEMMKAPERVAAPQAVPAPAAAAQGHDDGIMVDGVTTGCTQGGAGVMERTKVDTSHNIVKGPQEQEAAPAAPVPTFVPKGCYSLEDLRDVNVWKDAGIDADTREQYLSDEAFAAVFGCSKDEFAKMPKWKRDAQKKSHKLF